MKRAIRAIAAWVMIATMVIGAPVALLVLGRLSGLAEVDWAHLLTTQDTGALLLGVLTLAGWVAWGLFTLTVVAELAAQLSRGRIRLRLPLTGWARPIAGALVVAALGVAAPVAGHANVPVAVTAPAASSSTPAHSPSASNPEVHSTGETTAPASSAEPSAAKLATHMVVAGDDLWSIAEHYYGDGTKWRDLSRENRLDPMAVLPVGVVLQLPGLTAETLAATVEGSSVTVTPGDTLSGIADEELGDADRWPEIFDKNSDVISDPDVIEPGWVLDLPDDSSTPTTAEEQTGPGPVVAPTASAPATAPTASAPVTMAPAPPVAPARPPAEVPEAVPSPAAAQAPEPVEPEVLAASDVAPDGDQVAEVAGITGVLALSLLAAVALRRRAQLFHRPLGQRIPHAGEDAQRLEAALARRATLVTAEPETWPPAAVVVGVADDEPVVHDLEEARTTVITGPDANEVRGALAAALTGLVSASWSAETSVFLSGEELGWVADLDQPLLHGIGSVEDGVAELERQAAARRLALGRANGTTLAELRADAETAEAWQPQVHLFTETPSPEQWRRIRVALRSDSLAPEGVGACVLTMAELTRLPECGEALQLDGDTARLTGRGVTFVPQVIREPARHALMDLFHTTAESSTAPAPWWSSSDELPANLRLLEPATMRCDEEDLVTETEYDQPTVLVLGPIQLAAARGTEPSRARQQCLEYAAWVHQNPGRTAAMMNRSLMVADSTRRSNLSRLRTWLGSSEDGEPYLPDAYTGRIALHPAVATDWEHLQLLVGPGVDRASTDALVDALRLVRGAPLADAAPGCWHWAEEWRTDMMSTIRDIGVVLTQRALASGNIDVARWAAARALKAAPEDELLMVERVRTEHAAGNHREVERLVLHLNRVARILDVDLSEQTVAALQEVMEGRTRARFA